MLFTRMNFVFHFQSYFVKYVVVLIILISIQASLKAGLDLREAVALPCDEDLNDWLAVHGKIEVLVEFVIFFTFK